ncbi:hypothetical protein [Streptomyces sp. CC219B]|uniref:hypothetical protein n=1 Tax=Streptomyces sp. CC219B TaxID=3044574 RepID=UPI0024A82ABA|nr:hypothetical protein [Streptomyces sp. CC219B]
MRRLRLLRPADLPGVHCAPAHAEGRDTAQIAGTADTGRAPTLHTKIDSAETADTAVARGAGARRTP